MFGNVFPRLVYEFTKGCILLIKERKLTDFFLELLDLFVFALEPVLGLLDQKLVIEFPGPIHQLSLHFPHIQPIVFDLHLGHFDFFLKLPI